MAQAWLDAAEDLGIRVVHPYRFVTRSGVSAMTVGVFLPDFGAPEGMLLLCRFDSDRIDELAEDTDYRQSGLSPHYYEPYSRARYVQTLSDWGWFGAADTPPAWYDPDWRSNLAQEP